MTLIEKLAEARQEAEFFRQELIKCHVELTTIKNGYSKKESLEYKKRFSEGLKLAWKK